MPLNHHFPMGFSMIFRVIPGFGTTGRLLQDVATLTPALITHHFQMEQQASNVAGPMPLVNSGKINGKMKETYGKSSKNIINVGFSWV